MSIERMLGQFLGGSKPKTLRKADPDYAAFRAECKKQGLTYRVEKSDGYIELSNGVAFPHYHWGESLHRLSTKQYHE
jgi:hypothetical protein